MLWDFLKAIRLRRWSVLLTLAAVSAVLWGVTYYGPYPYPYLEKDILIKEGQEAMPRPIRKALVVASIKEDKTSWIEREFPDWERSIYVNDDPSANLTVPMNKGREGMAYLTYIINNYHDLPDYMVFIHGQRYQWHNDDPTWDSIPVLRNLRLPHLDSQGYINLRCTWNVGCLPRLRPVHPDRNQWVELHYADAFKQLFPGLPVPKEVGVSCCAQFAVTRERVLARPKRDYVRFRIWLLQTKLEDELSGRLLEYSWHMMFGMPAVHCPDMGECYCESFGICGQNCTGEECDRYVFPKDGMIPEHED